METRNHMVSFVLLVGIPASGKSTRAKLLSEKMDAVWLSSDNLREELFGDVKCQDRNKELFEGMNRKAIELLKSGKSVIYDATNLNSKRRKALLSQIPKGVYKHCLYMVTTLHRAYIIDANRDRTVGLKTIDRMYKTAQIPMYHEGFDSIMHYPLHRRLDNKKEFIMPNTYEEYVDFLKENGCGECVDLSQDTPYHTLSVSRHMYYAYEEIKDSDNEDLKIALLLHDIGKPYCKVFNGKYASFRGHENVSAQMAIIILRNYSLSEERIIRVATLIQLHMRMHNKEWGSVKRDKFRQEIGEEMWNSLVIMNNCDAMAK